MALAVSGSVGSPRGPLQRRQLDALTDDRAPVEWLTDRMLLDYIVRGGDLEEDLLPTAPSP